MGKHHREDSLFAEVGPRWVRVLQRAAAFQSATRVLAVDLVDVKAPDKTRKADGSEEVIPFITSRNPGTDGTDK